MVTDEKKGIRPEIIRRVEELTPISDHDYHKSHMRRTLRTIQVVLDQSPEGRLLEIGTKSVVPLALKTLAPNLEVSVTHFDLNMPTESTMELAMGDETIEVVSFSIDLETSEIPAPDGYYDYVLCAEVLEHMEIDPMHMLSELNRVLKPGGILIVTTPNVLSSIGMTKMVAGIEPYFYMQYQKSKTLYRHNYEYTVHSVAKILKAAGFNGSIWTEDTFEDPAPTVVARLNAAGFNIRNTGDNIFAVSKKVSRVIDRFPEGIYA